MGETLKADNFLIFAGLFLLLVAVATTADEDRFKDIEIASTPVAEGIFMLTGQAGNIGVSVGADGVFLIDDQFASLTEKNNGCH